MTNTAPAADFEYPATPDARSAGASTIPITAYLAKAWCDLNRARYADLGTHVRMAEIEAQIGLKACLREWNRGQMTDMEFDVWWMRRGRSLGLRSLFPFGSVT